MIAAPPASGAQRDRDVAVVGPPLQRALVDPELLADLTRREQLGHAPSFFGISSVMICIAIT